MKICILQGIGSSPIDSKSQKKGGRNIIKSSIEVIFSTSVEVVLSEILEKLGIIFLINQMGLALMFLLLFAIAIFVAEL